MPSETVMRPPADVPLTLVTLGGFALRDTRGEQLLGPGKPLALLVYLAASPGRTASREHLIDLLWADADPERARHALRQALWQLRQVLGEACLDGKEEIRLACDVGLDRNRFLAAIEAGELATALSIYGGPFITAFASPGGAAFEHWADGERLQLQSAFLRAAELHARRSLARGSPRDAITVSRRIKEFDPDGQSGPRLLIEAHLASGDALSAASEAERLLWRAREDEVELEPASEAMVRRALGRTTADESSGPTEVPATTRLTAELVGREREFATALAAWADARQGSPQHVHLVGAAGLGKTRLLLDLEARLRSSSARVRYLRAHPGDRELASSLASELARALASLPGAKGVSPEVAATLVALDPGLASHYDARADTATAAEAVRRRTLALAELARATAEEAPHALLIDDLHWADAESLTILEGLLARLDHTGILIVTATRPLGTIQLRSEARQAVALEPLTEEQVTELLESLARFPDAAHAQRIGHQLHLAAAGNPLMVLELLSLASEREALRIEGEQWVGPALTSREPVFSERDGIRQRLAQLGPEARRVLGALALAGTPLEHELPGEGVARPAQPLSTQLMLLARLGFVEDRHGILEPTHDEIASAAAAMDPVEEQRLRRALGRAFESRSSNSQSALRRSAHHYAQVRDSASLARLVKRARQQERHAGHDRSSLDKLLDQLVGGDPALRSEVRRLCPIRERLPINRMAVTAAAVVALLGVVLWRRSHVLAAAADSWASSVVLEVAWEGDGLPSWRTARIAIDPVNWDPERSLALGAPVLRNEPFVSWGMLGGYSLSGDTLLMSSTEDSASTGSQDILLIADGLHEVLTTTPGDDVNPAWTVDGRGYFLTTTRWSGTGPDDYSIGYHQLGADEVVPVARTPAREEFPVHSPDGTRVAYGLVPIQGGPVSLCVATFAGEQLACLPVEGAETIQPIAWADHDEVVVILSIGARRSLERMDTRTGRREQLLPHEAQTAAVDPGGEVLACICIDPARDEPRLYVSPLTAVDRGAWIDAPSEFPVGQVRMVKGRRTRPHLESLAIVADSVAPTGHQYQLRVVGRGTDGAPVAFDSSTVRWRILDGEGARIDARSGLLTMDRDGMVHIEVTAGGWRSATHTIRFRRASAALLLEEPWDAGALQARWRAFGRPSPFTGIHQVMGRALFPNGDNSFPSGVYSLASWPAGAGLTMEAPVAIPVNQPLHQTLNFGFRASTDSAVLEQWDHRTGGPPGTAASSIGTCGLAYPAGEGFAAWSRLSLDAGRRQAMIAVTRELGDGTPRMWRVTVFSDGRCGIAIDSVPIAISTSSVSLNHQLRAWLMGKSHGTTNVIGQLRLWRGDPGGVDWTRVQQ